LSKASLAGADRPELLAVAPAKPALPLVLRLCRLLEESEVAWCHWKSNAAIDRSACGDNDLDLLVQRSDVRRFTELLSNLGFVRAYKRGATIGGIESFYGFDAEADRLVHVHAHYQLVLGDDRTKNYRLPIEDAYIRSATQAGIFRLPAPSFEYVVFVIRMTLKYCTWDAIVWNAMRRRRASPSRTEREELEYLEARADEETTASILGEHLPYLDSGLFADCVGALASDAPLRRRIRTARRLERALQPHARHSRRVDRWLRIGRRIVLTVARRTRRGPKNRLAGGGAMVGIMGGDGAGKSTALAALGSWLGPEFDVRLVHLGKPRWSVTTYVVRAALKVVSMALDVLQRWVRAAPFRRLALLVSTYRRLVWLVCTARDRHLAYRGARRFAIGGGLVLCDRYPHPRLASMEAPLIASLAAGRLESRLVRAMIRIEQRYHHSIAPPELLVVLRVDPEIAVTRKRDENPNSVRTRGAEIWNIDWRETWAHVIDASQPEEAVARELKALVWSNLG
jgi:thymidylate kinase